MKVNKRLLVACAALFLILSIGGFLFIRKNRVETKSVSEEANVTQTTVDNSVPVDEEEETDISTQSPAPKTIKPSTTSSTSATTDSETEPETEPTPEPQPAKVVSYEQVPLVGSEDIDCKLTYSDGTTTQWHWKVVEFNQVKITTFSGKCNATTIGTIKS